MSETGKLAKLIRHSIYIFFICWMVVQIFKPMYWLSPADATDSPHRRSGMSLHVDYGTGCQYLRASGLTPRLDNKGKHICGEHHDER